MPESRIPRQGKVPTGRELDQATQPLPKDAPLRDKLVHLKSTLELSDTLDATAWQDALRSPESRRFAAGIALRSIISFLDSVDLHSGTLRSVLLALYDHEDGHVHPLVTPSK